MITSRRHFCIEFALPHSYAAVYKSEERQSSNRPGRCGRLSPHISRRYEKESALSKLESLLVLYHEVGLVLPDTILITADKQYFRKAAATGHIMLLENMNELVR